jgi:AraC-like DNA-binding protein
MHDSFDAASAPRDANFLWVNLTREARTALAEGLVGAFDIRQVGEPTQIPGAIQVHAPRFLCFEFDEPHAPGIDALVHTRRAHPSLPVLMITGSQSQAVAIWALRIRVWDLLVKPISNGELSQRIVTLIELTRRRGPRPALEALLPPQSAEALPVLHGSDRRGRTYPAIAHVAAHVDCKIALDHVAALCQLSPSQFCRVFRQEHGVSFGQYLLRYRTDRACERLAQPGALAKEVAYSVGFNDLSYFTRAFKRRVGVCPSEYRAGAGLS